MEEIGLQNLINYVKIIRLIINILVKTLKHGLTIIYATSNHAQTWDEHLPLIMFGYRCGVQLNIKFSPHMILINHTPNFALDYKLHVDNFLQSLVNTYSGDDDFEVLAKKMIEKMQLIVKMHGHILDNVS
jgi:hypothetical protein